MCCYRMCLLGPMHDADLGIISDRIVHGLFGVWYSSSVGHSMEGVREPRRSENKERPTEGQFCVVSPRSIARSRFSWRNMCREPFESAPPGRCAARTGGQNAKLPRHNRAKGPPRSHCEAARVTPSCCSRIVDFSALPMLAGPERRHRRFGP